MLSEDDNLRLVLVEMRAARRHIRKALEHTGMPILTNDPYSGLALVLAGWLRAVDHLLGPMSDAVDSAMEDLKHRVN